jgi:putative flippase GtrA
MMHRTAAWPLHMIDRRRTWPTFLRFAGLSGAGWLADFGLLMLFVGVAGISSFTANLMSSLIAASAVFMMSRRVVFAPTSKGWRLRLAGYLLYTVLVIFIASVALDQITLLLRHVAAGLNMTIPLVVLSALAKIAVTPPQLLLNFAVSRTLNERAF